MNAKEKIDQLKKEIKRQLTLLITGDYVYLDLPYHSNIGDTLIWKGTLDYLNMLGHKCLMSTDCYNFTFPHLPQNCIILLHGGGNFGDLYPKHNNFRKAVIAKYPLNRVVVLPQTVFYEKDDNLKADIEFYANRDNVTICVRDTESYKIIADNFRGPSVCLVPDMAFFINQDVYKSKISKKTKGRTLYLKRSDKEAVDSTLPQCVPANAEVHDWPTFERISAVYWFCLKGIGLLKRIPCIDSLRRRYTDFVWQFILLPYNVRIGMNFLCRYDTIYTTRLHTLILSVLLNRQSICLLDNNYGKLRSFYETWLTDLNDMRYIKQKNGK